MIKRRMVHWTVGVATLLVGVWLTSPAIGAEEQKSEKKDAPATSFQADTQKTDQKPGKDQDRPGDKDRPKPKDQPSRWSDRPWASRPWGDRPPVGRFEDWGHRGPLPPMDRQEQRSSHGPIPPEGRMGDRPFRGPTPPWDRQDRAETPAPPWAKRPGPGWAGRPEHPKAPRPELPGAEKAQAPWACGPHPSWARHPEFEWGRAKFDWVRGPQPPWVRSSAWDRAPAAQYPPHFWARAERAPVSRGGWLTLRNPAAMFRRLDLNGDGVITRAEFFRAWTQVVRTLSPSGWGQVQQPMWGRPMPEREKLPAFRPGQVPPKPSKEVQPVERKKPPHTPDQPRPKHKLDKHDKKEKLEKKKELEKPEETKSP